MSTQNIRLNIKMYFKYTKIYEVSKSESESESEFLLATYIKQKHN